MLPANLLLDSCYRGKVKNSPFCRICGIAEEAEVSEGI